MNHCPRVPVYFFVLVLCCVFATSCGEDGSGDSYGEPGIEKNEQRNSNPSDPAEEISGKISLPERGINIDLGSAALFPKQARVASKQRFLLEYTVGEPIGPGGQIQITFGYGLALKEMLRMTTDPSHKYGLVTASTRNPKVSLALTVARGEPTGVRLAHAIAQVQEGTLRTGEKVVFVYGANQGLAVVQEIAQEAEVTVQVRPGPGYPMLEIAESPVLNVRPGSAHRLVSAVDLRGNLLRLVVVDRFGNRVDDYRSKVSLSAIRENGQEVTWGRAVIRDGRADVPLPAAQPGYYVLRAVCATDRLASQVPYAPGHQRSFFGDPHFHTKFSDSTVAMDMLQSYAYARDVALLDFASATDHAELIAQNDQVTRYLVRDIPNTWSEIQRINSEYNKADRGLVTLLGYETTINNEAPRDGHQTVYYRGSKGDFYTYEPVVSSDRGVGGVEELWDKFDRDGTEAMTIGHHTLAFDKGSDQAAYDPKYMRVIEIFSHHGCSESTDCRQTLHDPIADPDALGTVQRAVGPLGYRLGFVGGSDNHSGHPSGTGLVDRAFPKFTTGGMTAALVDDLTRDTLWDAMETRSVYATSGARIYMEFGINGNPMGSEIESSGTVNIDARAIGTDNVALVEIVKYSESEGWRTVLRETPGNLFWDGSFDEENFVESSVYYLRITQRDGFMAWSSPIWVDCPLCEAYYG
jgi:Protein of unknown function (DUF3604)